MPNDDYRVPFDGPAPVMDRLLAMDQDRRDLCSAVDAWRTECERLTEEIAKLRTVMIAAVEEIDEHWDAHCDDEGYGPVKLMHRLEGVIGTGYDGYTPGEFQRLHDAAESLRWRSAEEPHPVNRWILVRARGGKSQNAWLACYVAGQVILPDLEWIRIPGDLDE